MNIGNRQGITLEDLERGIGEMMDHMNQLGKSLRVYQNLLSYWGGRVDAEKLWEEKRAKDAQEVNCERLSSHANANVKEE